MSLAIKICGLTTGEAVQAAVDAGATALGFVFAESPRQVAPERARELLGAVPEGVERIAVFRRPSAEQVKAIATLPLDGLQADADWPGEALLPPGWWFLPVFRNVEGVAARIAERLWSEPQEPTLRGTFLLDGPQGGGQGVRGDTERAARIARQGPMVLAGGLDPDNVAQAIRAVEPHGVDVSSGVESTRGVKDPARIQAFVRAAREAAETR